MSEITLNKQSNRQSRQIRKATKSFQKKSALINPNFSTKKMAEPKHNYNEDSIRTLDWKEHIRMRPGMYIGKLGDGASPDDGIYVLLKEVMDNCIDEFAMGYGKTIEIKVEGKQ